MYVVNNVANMIILSLLITVVFIALFGYDGTREFEKRIELSPHVIKTCSTKQKPNQNALYNEYLIATKISTVAG